MATGYEESIGSTPYYAIPLVRIRGQCSYMNRKEKKMYVILNLFGALLTKPFIVAPLTFLIGILFGIFAPTLWILLVSMTVIVMIIVSLALFFATMRSPDGGLGPLLFLAPVVFGSILLLGIGIAYYLATGQTGLQELFASLRALSN